MKLKKSKILIMIAFITLILPIFFNVVKADPFYVDDAQVKVISLTYAHQDDENIQVQTGNGLITINRMGYKNQRNNANKVVFKLVQIDENKDWPVETWNDFNQNIYCIKGNAGFSGDFLPTDVSISVETDLPRQEEKEYYRIANFKHPNEIPAVYQEQLNMENYEKILWILDNSYVRESAGTIITAEEANRYMNRLLVKAGLQAGSLSKNDIEFVQQLAIWHYANPNERHDIGTAIEDYGYFNAGEPYVEGLMNSIDSTRVQRANTLYQYLIADHSNETINMDIGADQNPVIIDNTNPSIVNETDTKYIIGPFRILNEGNYTVYDYTANINIPHEVLNSNQQPTNSTIEQLTGHYFYISVEKDANISDFKLSIQGKYYQTKIEYWHVQGQQNVIEKNQPVGIIDRKEKSFNSSKPFSIQPPVREPDLALKKYIVAIKDESGAPVYNGRTLRISSVEGLKNGTSQDAVYELDKQTITVSEKDTVIYEIKIFNEGDVDGSANSIYDFLPAGLKLKAGSEINVNNEWHELEGQDGKTWIYSEALKGQTINKFDRTTGTAGSLMNNAKSLQVECVIDQEALEGIDSTILKNVAEIGLDSFNYGSDRDSNPGDLSTTSCFNGSRVKYEIVDDDEDYEQIRFVKAEIPQFDLALKKYISKVTKENGDVITTDRSVTVTSTDGLNNPKFNANYNFSIADFILNPVQVEVGDTIEFTIRVFNEGTEDGYVKEIVDYLPKELKLKDGSQINTTYGWSAPETVEENNRKKITTEFGSNELLTKFNGGNSLSNREVKVECVIDESKVTSTTYGRKILNLAEIKDDEFESNYPNKKDRDSDINNLHNHAYQPAQDDEFADCLVIIQPEIPQFDLTLKKFISKLVTEEQEVPVVGREPLYDTTPLKNETDTNARWYGFDKSSPVIVEIGDLVEYKIRIYNEGDVDGKVTKVVDYLPVGLDFVQGHPINNGWNAESTGNAKYPTKVSTELLAGQTISAFDGGDTLDYKELSIICRVSENQNNSSRLVLKNVAEIFTDVAINEPDIDDRDSNPGDLSTTSCFNGSRAEFAVVNDDEDYDIIRVNIPDVEPEKFDLALRKSIIKIDNTSYENERIPQTQNMHLDLLALGEENAGINTAIYVHPKNALTVRHGSIVTYRIQVYNEGTIDGYATSIVDYLPKGLEFIDNPFNRQRGWVAYSHEGNEQFPVKVVTKALDNKEKIIKAFNAETLEIDCKYIDIQCRVNQEVFDFYTTYTLKNVAEIEEAKDINGNLVVSGEIIPGDGKIIDRDSDPNNVLLDGQHTVNFGINGYIPGEEDDDDFERVSLTVEPPEIPQDPTFDLVLRKYISKIVGPDGNEVSFANREPKVDVSQLVNSGSRLTTAIYRHPKNTIEVENGSIVTYRIRVYNEAGLDGYAKEIIDYLPEGLELVENSRVNRINKWNKTDEQIVANDGTKYTKIVSDGLAGTKILAFDKNSTEPKSEYLEIECIVNSTSEKTLKNVAEITADLSDYVSDKPDRDSNPEVNVFDDGLHRPGTTYDGYTPGEEDDDDFERIKVKKETPPPVLKFDLALQKFILAVGGTPVRPPRTPEYDTTPLINGEDNADYGTKPGPYPVATNDIVTYVIRVYNEGQVAGTATEVSDYLPAGLEYIDNEFNRGYGWRLDPDSEEQLEGHTKITTDYLKDEVIEPFNPEVDAEHLDYRDIQVQCRVVATAGDEQINLRNIAEIEDDDNEDNDSTPGNISRENEDDDDYEDLYIAPVIKNFDLALRKFVSSVKGKEITNREPVVDVTPLKENGRNTTAIYNHPKAPVSVSIGNEVIYTIRVYNEGEVDGYVTEITDHIPQYLEFLVEDEFNAQYGWKLSEDGKFVTTDITSPDTVNSANRDLLYKDRENGYLLKAFDGEKLDYIDVQIKCKVKENSKLEEKITNIAEITGAMDVKGNIVVAPPQAGQEGKIKDIDSIPNDVTVPVDANLSAYKDDEIASGKTYIPGQQDDDDFEKLALYRFDLALQKFITAVGNTQIKDRVPGVTVNQDGTITYTHPTDPVLVEVGDIVTYTIRVYNEGNQAGYAAEVMDNIPEGLEYLPTNATNLKYGWKMYKKVGEEYIEVDNVEEAQYIKTTYLSKEDGENANPARDNLIPGFNPETMNTPAYKDIEVAFKVKEPDANDMDRIYTNIAEISDDSDENGDPVGDDDSTPGNGDPNEDDIDDEVVYVKIFDLALQKFITAVGDTQITNRVPVVTVNEDGTITYQHPSTPVEVGIGDIVTYTIRVYNEGEADGYASEITDNIPNGLIFLPENATNVKYGWKMYKADGTETDKVEEAVEIKTTYLSKEDGENANPPRDNLIPAFNPDTMEAPAYKDIKVAFKVAEPAEDDTDRVYVNIAEISDDSDSDGDPVGDDDSTPGNGTPGEDDIDEEVVHVKYFDLALRKFVSAVNEEEITSRIPVVTVNENGTITYNHPKDPVEVVNGDIVTYTIRVYNEGQQEGYAAEITDNIPNGLIFLPDNAINVEYGWKMYRADGTETENVEEAVEIKTTYLSKEDGENADPVRDNLLQGFDPETMTMPDYKDVRVAFRVTEPDAEDTDRTYVNIAEISGNTNGNGDPIGDNDSTPGNGTPGEDDIDEEKVKVKYFDLALQKWVSTVTTTLNGKTTVIKTGHTGEENPEPPVKLEVKEDELNRIVVKFTYTIKVTNEGEIPGYATEITEYIPQGLKFVAADNPDWKEENGKVVTTKLANILLRPGESTMVQIVLTWINGSDNFGQKVNIAEISKDKNDSNTPDRDSTPDNRVPTEDDIDRAPVVLTIKTGVEPTYIVLATAVLAIISTGVVLIKKYVM